MIPTIFQFYFILYLLDFIEFSWRRDEGKMNEMNRM